MPTYDYRCNACGHEFEEFQSMTAPLLKKCPKCGKLKLERLIGTGAALLFKGSGFYQTDYRTDSYRKAADADKPSTESKSDSKSDAKADSKTDAKAGPKPETKTESKALETPSTPKVNPTASKSAAKAGSPKPSKGAGRKK